MPLIALIFNPRIFVLQDAPQPIHDILKQECIWGGSDKTIVIEGLTYLGYEFRQDTDGKYYSRLDLSIGTVVCLLEDEFAKTYVKPKPDIQTLYRLLHIKIYSIVNRALTGEIKWDIAYNQVFAEYNEWSSKYGETLEWYDPDADYSDDVLAFYNHVKSLVIS